MGDRKFQIVHRYCPNCRNKYDEDELKRLFKQTFNEELNNAEGVEAYCLRCETRLEKSGVPAEEDEKTLIFERDINTDKIRDWGHRIFR